MRSQEIRMWSELHFAMLLVHDSAVVGIVYRQLFAYIRAK